MGIRNKIERKPFPENKREKIFYISRLIGSYYASKNYAVFKEIGLPKVYSDRRYGSKRADILCINSKDEVIILETKSSWQDYKTDNKWEHYLDWCHKFYFVAEDSLASRIKEDLKNKEVGVIAIKVGAYEDKPFFIKNAKRREPELLSHNLKKLYKAIIFRSSSFRMNGCVNLYSQFYPPHYISAHNLMDTL